MNDSFPRAGPRRRGGGPACFGESLSLLRDRLRDGLAEAASRAASETVRRLTARLLGGGGDRPDAYPAGARENGNTGWDDPYDPGGWGDSWPDRDVWGEPDEPGDRDVIQDGEAAPPGLPRRPAAAACQALAWLSRALTPGGPALGELASALLSALALLLGGGRYGCEAGLALAEALWAAASALTQGPGTFAGDEAERAARAGRPRRPAPDDTRPTTRRHTTHDLGERAMTKTMSNGSGRRQLSDQIDRLDGVIDALDEGLRGAVADAVREAVGAAVSEAVQAVLLELMTNPQLREAVRPAPAETPERKEDEQPKPPGSLLSRAWGKSRSVARSCAKGVKAAAGAARLAWALAGDKLRALALAAAAGAVAAAYAARAKIASAARAARGACKDLLGKAAGCLGRLAPALAT